jgi:hypothetical protein
VEVVLSGRQPLFRSNPRTFEAGDDLHIDARRLLFASPLDLVGIASLAHDAALSGLGVTMTTPSDTEVASYLQRMDLFSNLPHGVVIEGDLPPEERNDLGDVLLELRVLHNSPQAELVAESVIPIARRQSDTKVSNAVFFGIGEFLDNACSHADSSAGVFVAAQAYSGKTSGHRGLELAVGDVGVGILDHLTGNPKYSRFRRDVTAIQYALRPGVTGTRDARGYGFSDVLNETGEAGVGRLIVRSGNGIGRVTVRGGRTHREFAETRFWTPGTWVWLRVRVP